MIAEQKLCCIFDLAIWFIRNIINLLCILLMVCCFVLNMNDSVCVSKVKYSALKSYKFQLQPSIFKWEDAHQIQDAWMFIEWHDEKAFFFFLFCNIATRPNLFPWQHLGLFFIFILTCCCSWGEQKKYPINRRSPISLHKSLTWKWNCSDKKGDG